MGRALRGASVGHAPLRSPFRKGKGTLHNRAGGCAAVVGGRAIRLLPATPGFQAGGLCALWGVGVSHLWVAVICPGGRGGSLRHPIPSGGQ